MRKPLSTGCLLIVLVLAARTVNAWHARGCVFCDANGNGQIDGEDIPLSDVLVIATDLGGTFFESERTALNGCYVIKLLDVPESYRLTLDVSTLPPDVSFVVPNVNEQFGTTTDVVTDLNHQWLVASPTCVQAACWLTGGGVKFDTITGAWLAEHGPKHTFGGNVFPSCDPDPGQGG